MQTPSAERAFRKADRAAGLVGIAAAAALAVLSPGAPLVAAATLPLVAWIIWRDATGFVIPDPASLALAAIGVAARLADDGASLATALSLGADVALTGGALWLLREAFYRLRGHDGLGFGDVKLAAAGGCLIGAEGVAAALLAASLAGLAVAALRGAGRMDRIAFGAFFAPAIWLVLVGAAVWPPLMLR
ncbi:prepilin peptidase [Methylopila henanensis]|uniref:Prepilin peptidase n=1 Tax=Methylopila henanensis TaxID=873516 RepID=A0ABW4K8U9_9HYPH